MVSLTCAPVRRTSLRMFGRLVEVWVTTLWPGAGDDAAPTARWLSDGERARCSMISGRDQRAQFTVGRALVRHILGHRFGMPPRQVPLTEDIKGRPCLRGHSGYDFNLSHSGTRVALVVARGMRVGVDIERLVERDSAVAISQRYFDDRERSLLERISDRAYLDHWYQIWTTREAHAKARGSGIRGLCDPLNGYRSDWLRRSMQIGERYVGSVVALHPQRHPLTKELNHDY